MTPPDGPLRPTGSADRTDRAAGRTRRIADASAASALVALELLALDAVLDLWFPARLTLGPVAPPPPHPLWGYLAITGALCALLVWTARAARRRGARVTAWTQGLMAVATAVLLMCGTSESFHGYATMPPPDGCGTSPSVPRCGG
ncbi:DUF6234 family protein [Streptomyces carminius]|nr:DUF6234 family protein [Streptomyces carminius]